MTSDEPAAPPQSAANADAADDDGLRDEQEQQIDEEEGDEERESYHQRTENTDDGPGAQHRGLRDAERDEDEEHRDYPG